MIVKQEKNRFLLPSLLALLLALGLYMPQLHAFQGQSLQLDRLFTIQNIAVDITAKSASSARDEAFQEAEKIAYKKLLVKLTQPEGRVLLPELEISDIQSMVSGIEVSDEKTSARRYTARMNIRFEPSVFSDFLASHNVGHVLSTGNGVLVLHAHHNGLVDELWNPPLSVKQARDKVDWLNRIRGYIFPKGEISERKLVSAGEVALLKVSAVQSLVKKYEAESVLYISSQSEITQGDILKLSYSYYAPGSGLRDSGVLYADSKAEEQALTLMYETILEQIDSVWRKQLLVDTGEGGRITATVPVIDIDSFVHIQKMLKTVSLVRNVSVELLNIPESRLYFDYTGSREQLTIALQFAGLKLEKWGADNRITQDRQD